MGAWDYLYSGDGSYDVLEKNVADFYPCRISLLKVQVKRFTLFGLTITSQKSPHKICPDNFQQEKKTKNGKTKCKVQNAKPHQ